MTKEESKHHLELYAQLQSENERLIKEIEDRVVKCILDDIDFGYDLATIKGKIKSGSYVGNSPETFTENEMMKSELSGNPEQLKAELDISKSLLMRMVTTYIFNVDENGNPTASMFDLLKLSDDVLEFTNKQ